MKNLRLIAIGALLLTTGSLLAHHSGGAIYDLRQQVILKGRVTKVTFRNPHSTLTIETKNSSTWEGEWTSWDGLARQGVREETIKSGDFLEMVGSPARDPNSRVVAVLWEVRRPADGWRWVSSEVFPGPRVIE